MKDIQRAEQPFRVGIFDTMQQADRAVAELLSAGFTKDDITVICSEKAVQEHFKQFEHEDPAGAHTPAAVVGGGAVGATLGGLAALAGAATLGGVGLLVAGGLALWSGGVVGGLVGAMMTRGVEKEIADYYDQAVTNGRILVAAEQKNPEDPAQLARLQRAAEILRHQGVEPLPLREG